MFQQKHDTGVCHNFNCRGKVCAKQSLFFRICSMWDGSWIPDFAVWVPYHYLNSIIDVPRSSWRIGELLGGQGILMCNILNYMKGICNMLFVFSWSALRKIIAITLSKIWGIICSQKHLAPLCRGEAGHSLEEGVDMSGTMWRMLVRQNVMFSAHHTFVLSSSNGLLP